MSEEQYIQSLKTVLQQKKVWERNELLEAFRRQLKAEAKMQKIKEQERAKATRLSAFIDNIKT